MAATHPHTVSIHAQRNISGIIALFLAPTFSNYCWCVHVFNSAPGTCQYFFCLLKILITIRENTGVGKKRENFRKAKQPISQNRSVWKHDEFSYSLLKGLFRTEDCGEEDAAEDLFLTHIHAAGSRFMKGPWRLLLPPGVCHRDNIFFFPTWACIQRLSSTEHLARQRRVGSISSYRHRDRGFNEDVGVQNAEGERMRCPFISPSHALFL